MTDTPEDPYVEVFQMRLLDPTASQDGFEEIALNGDGLHRLDWINVTVPRASITQSAQVPTLYLLNKEDIEAYAEKYLGGDDDVC